MTDKAWKREEREVAKAFGGKRTPLSGSRSGHLTRADCLVDDYYIEVKLRAKSAVNTLFSTVKAQAKREGRIPILTIRTNANRDRVAVVDFNWLLTLLGGKCE